MHATPLRDNASPALLLALLIGLAALASACSTTTWQPAARHPFDAHSALEINDQDIARAFEAQPQLPARPLRVAWFTWEPERRDAIAEALSALPNVESTYAIPSLFVTGEGRFQATANPWPPANPAPLSVKQLRLLAARAQADVLLIIDHGWRQTTTANGLAALNVLLIPALFTPFLDLQVESYVDTFAIDVRNGYLYGQLASTEADQEDYRSIYGVDPLPLVDAQWTRLLEQLKGKLPELMQQAR